MAKVEGTQSNEYVVKDVENTYRLCLKFYKDNEGKTFHLRYETKLRLVSLAQQALHGPLQEQQQVLPLGALDVIGRDRRNAWSSLGNMSRLEAQQSFITEALASVPYLEPFLQAHLKADDVKNDSEQAGLSLEPEEKAEASSPQQLQEEQQKQVETQRRQIQDALNRRTFAQFRAYAEQQYPSNPDQQALLIRQLQEQHYSQYMQQTQQRIMESKLKDSISGQQESLYNEEATLAESMANLELMNGEAEGQTPNEDEFQIEAASMWTRKEIVSFKASLRAESDEATLKIDHGETVTVRVPTHHEGSAIFFEFRDENQPEETEVSVHVSDSDEDDLDDDEDEDENDPECGPRAALVAKGPPTTVIIPLYRRDSHLEVYAGSHTYPGKGVYLLKFDNSYSLWRSKTLYYRVYYTK